MSTPPEINALLKWQRDHAGEVAYSETASTRLASDTAHLTSTTDCSGMAIRMLRHFGGPAAQAELEGATYTGNLCRLGELITTSRSKTAAGDGLLPGDLVFFTWNGHNPAFDHVAIYAGHGRIWNHGGPGRGPVNWSLRDNVGNASEVMVRRYPTSRPAVTPDASHPAPSDTSEEFHVTPADEAKIAAIVRKVVRDEGNKGFNVRYLMTWTGKFNSMETFVAGSKAGYSSIATRVAAAAKKAVKR